MGYRGQVMKSIFQVLLLSLAATLCGCNTESPQGKIESNSHDVDHASAVRKRGLLQQRIASPGGKFFVYVMDTPEVEVDTGGGGVPATELWIRENSSGKETKLIRGRYNRDPKKTIAGIHDPCFSPDEKEVFFTSAAYATSDTVQRVNISTKDVKYVSDGSLLSIVPSGKYKGLCLVYRSLIKFEAQGETLGRDSYLWLVSPTRGPLVEIGRTGSVEEKDFLKQIDKEMRYTDGQQE
jgi:hypothetical protein